MLKQGDIELRALEPEDLDLVLQMENDSDMWLHGSSNVPYSRFAIRQYIENNQFNIYADGQLRMVICLSGVAVGLVDLVSFDARNNRAEVGIALLTPYREQGIGTQALSLLGEYAFNFLHIHQLYAYVSVQNEASMRLFRSAGYKEASRLGDWLALGGAYVDAALFVARNEQ